MARRKRVAAYLRQPGRRGYRNGFPGRAASVVHERIRRAVRTARDNGILQTGAFGPVRLPRLRLLLVPDGTQIVKTKSRPYENTSPKLLAVPCVPKRISCSTSVSPQTNRDDLPNSRRTECRSWRNTATPSRWRNSFAPLTGYCRRSTRPGHAADAGSARTAKYNISSTCDAIIPNYGQNWSS